MSIRWKLPLTITLVLVANLAVGYYAAINYKRAIREATLIREHSEAVVTTALSAQVHFKKQVQEWKDILLRGHEPSLYRKYMQQFLDEEGRTRQKTRELLERLRPDTEAAAIAQSFLDVHEELGRTYRDALQRFDTKDPLSHLDVDREVRGIDRRPTDLIDEVVNAALAFNEQRLAESARKTTEIEHRLLLASLGLLALTFLALLGAADRLIARPITLATQVARRISQGDLSGEIPRSGNDEAGQLLQAMQIMQGNLLKTRDELRQEKALLARRVKERTRELNFANEELARAAKAKDLFLAAMSHELRTPLTTILGLTEMLTDELYGPISASQSQSLQTIDESARHLLALINDILDVAKIESGKMQLNFDFIPIEQLVEASVRLIRTSARRKQQQLEHRIDPQVKLIHGDSRRLKQVIVNLLDNAVKFTPEKGRIGLDVSGDPEHHKVHITVWDTGIGIAEGQLEELFEPFVQLDNPSGGRQSGTGLGLTLVNRMAAFHGGSVNVTSRPQAGSRFTLSLPWDTEHNDPGNLKLDHTPADDQRFSPQRLKQITILLAEENRANRAMVRKFLTHQGFHVVAAETGPDTLELATTNRPDLILMGIQLEQLDGLEVTRRLREVPGFAHVPVIAFTTLAMPGDRERCLAAGMDDYISKPVGLKELQQRIIDHLKDNHPAFTA
jgi:signal transduction histidine kinase/ActR/RegA family two-component response regulator